MARARLTFLCAGLFAFGGMAPSVSHGNSDVNGPPNAAGVLEDVNILEHLYQQLHPGLYRYNSPEQMHRNFDQLRQTLQRKSDLATTYIAFSQLAATVKCGHTYANFYNQSEAIQKNLFEQPNRVPFYFVWLGGRMIVTRDFTTNHELPKGTEVLAIAGIPSQAILSRLMTVARADGSNDAKRIALMQVQGLDKYESFDVYTPLLFPQIGQRQRLTIRHPGSNTTEHVTVQAETYAQRLSHVPSSSPSDAAWTLTFPHERWAMLRMPTWALYDSHWDWKKFLATSFAKIQQNRSRVLILDLRGNEGGLDVGWSILPYLIDHPVDIDAPQRLVRYRQIPKEMRPYLDTWDPSFFDWGTDAQARADGFYTLKSEPDAPEARGVSPAKPYFRGRVYVLIDAMNSSATFQFAQYLQQLRLATLVGRPTGGNKRGINGGAFFFVRLPHSGIELDLPLIATVPRGRQPDEGVQPDIATQVTIEDVRGGRDPDMAAIERDVADEPAP